MSVNLREVAKVANVSVSTVSRVTRGKGYVKRETKDRVCAAINKLNYTPNSVARSLKYGRSFIIGFIVHDIANPFFSNAIKGAETYIEENKLGYDLMIINSGGKSKKEIRALEVMINRQVDGVILASTALHDCVEYEKKLLKNSKIPVISIDNQLNGLENGIVTVDNRIGAYQLIEHLVDHHSHTHIGIISGPPYESHATARLEGCVQALTEKGLSLEKSMTVAVGDWTSKRGYEITKSWLKSNNPPTAIFCANNFMCMGAISALRDSKKRIPEDIAIVAFDDVEFGYLIQPQLTSLKYSYERIGVEAIELLIHVILEGKDNAERITRTIPIELKIKESCGCMI